MAPNKLIEKIEMGKRKAESSTPSSSSDQAFLAWLVKHRVSHPNCTIGIVEGSKIRGVVATKPMRAGDLVRHL